MKGFGLRLVGWGALGIATLIAPFYARAPREDDSTDFTLPDLPDDLDAWLSTNEDEVSGLREGAAKRIVWAKEPGQKTDWAVVYVHGFSATAEEIRPVPDRLAEALGANLYFARLTGHGCDGPALAKATVMDWSRDYAETLAISRRLGRKVIVVATSTAGTLATLAAHEGLAPDAFAFVSPNFGLANPAGRILAWRGARRFLPRLFGATRNVTRPDTPGYNAHWTTIYPSVAVLPMAALVRRVAASDHSQITTPALFYFTDADHVVSAAKTHEVAEQWGGKVTLSNPVIGPDDDPFSHIIAGDIVSPGQTDAAVATMTIWANNL